MTTERHYTILLAPHFSEKISSLTDASNQYAFKVARDATKSEIKAAVESIFSVSVGKRLDIERARQGKADPTWYVAQEPLEKGVRAARARSNHRSDGDGLRETAMAVVKTKPTSPGRRFVVKVVNPELHKGEPHWPLVETSEQARRAQ